MNKITSLFILLFIAGASCEKKQNNEENTNKDTMAVDSSQMKKENKPELVLQWSTDTTLKTCESVLYDKNNNVLYVANIEGDPTKKDNNGFIAKVSPDGKIENLKWITGLSAPKGMGLSNGKLYVTDITAVAEIDTAKGKVVKRHEVPGAKFLNDIAVGEDGTVYFTDSETNKIHTLKNGKVETFLADSLKGPNGLYVLNGKLYLASMGTSDFRAIDLATKKDTVLATGIGAGDGVEYTGKDETFVVSNWMGQVFLVKDGKADLLLDTQNQKLNSADIGFIPEKNIVLVPTFFGNKVDAYLLKME